ncbi:MAG TPA: hypothetical protein VD788_15355 [Candidatus Polarisedimenticolaceae bacterium]|nr:hypothetical protein [Candidatus Polarisedimenticolaceae bacterium]
MIILTTGLSGSSPVAGLIARAGYWAGESTHKKRDYDTFENQKLIELNLKILSDVAYSGKYEMEFSRDAIDRIAESANRADLSPYADFVSLCNQHGPWIWKDPRLWLTIRFWRHVLRLDDVQFIVLMRDHLQTWVSTTIRRQIHSYGYSKRYTEQVRGSIVEFLDGHDQPYLELLFEDLVIHPERTLDEINGFLGTGLGMDDLKTIYTKPLYKRPRGVADFVKATMIYAKNYRSRYR